VTYRFFIAFYIEVNFLKENYKFFLSVNNNERSDTMANNFNINEIRKNVIDRLVKTSKDPLSNDHLTMDLWEWPQGVALYGLLKNYENSKDENYINYLISWYENMLSQELPEKNVNTMAPFLTLAHIYELTKNEKYLEYCTEWAEWIMHEMPRTEEGGLQHITTHLVNEGQLWDDTLFMTVLFLAKMGKVLGNEDYINESIKQFLLHIKYLFDPRTGLWFHGWTFLERNHFGDVFWGRGNCWFTAGAVEFIEILELECALKDYIIDTLEAQVKKLVELQSEGGMWHTVLDDSTSYVETSATAGFAFGILKAVRKGYISDKYLPAAQKAVNAVLKAIKEDGTVEGVSYGTAIGMDKNHYKNIEICPTAYGQALSILLLTEL
jgi:unsaturated rhamnogalacturonyl hydrolase